MSYLLIFPDDAPETVLLETGDHDVIARELGTRGVRFERWLADVKLLDGATQDEILAAYGNDVRRLKEEKGYQSADVVRLVPDPADPEGFAVKAKAARSKFLAEHIHAEDEVRFFVEGAGLFYLHMNQEVLAIRCERGDLISVPDRTTHWFDMGETPYFCAVRLFTNPEGWVAEFSGSDIAARFITFDQLSERTGFRNTVAVAST